MRKQKDQGDLNPEARRRAERDSQQLARLQEVSAGLARALSPAEVGDVFLAAGLKVLGAPSGAVFALSGDGRLFEMLSSVVREPGDERPFLRIPVEEAPSWMTTLGSGESLYFNLPDFDSNLPRALGDLLRKLGRHAVAIVPLRASDRPLGIMAVSFNVASQPDGEARELLEGLKDQCAVAFERAQLFTAAQVARGEAEQARADAEQANRAKDEFLAMLGHELRNPLAPISTALELMRLRDGQVHLRERAVIERQVAHLVGLVDDLLDISRITRGKIDLDRRPVELLDVVTRAVEMASPIFEERSQHLRMDVPRVGLVVNADTVRLAQVVSNLLTNAARYSSPGAAIHLEARREGEEVVLRVRDDGVGISAELLPRIFGMFVQGERTSDRQAGGLGLGLTIVQSLVRMHDGTVSATSDGPGRGATFTVRLPAAIRATAAEPVEAARAPAAAGTLANKPRLLVVDDNVDAAELLAEILTLRGAEVRVAHDGPVALQVAQTFLPVAALLDIGLPVMDGYELAGRLRKLPGLAGIRLIAVTGYAQEKDRLRATQAGFDQHLSKPLDEQALDRVLSEIVDGRK